MKRKIQSKFALALAILFTIFTLPVNGLAASAEDNGYDDIADGTYDITAKAMNADKDEASGAAGFINEDAQLIVKEGNVQLKIGVPENDMATIDGIQIEDKEGKTEVKNDVKYYTFNLNKLKQELSSQIQYVVPSFGIDHDVPFRFNLEGLEDLPVKKTETKTETVTEEIDFETVEEEDSSLKKDETKVKQKGEKGEKEVEYEVTYKNGEETKREVKNENVIKDAVNKIILIGTKTTDSNKKPETEVKEEKDIESIDFKTDKKNDNSLEKGKTKVKQKGKKGEKKLIYEVTYKNGEEIDRKLEKETVKKNPVNKIVAVGTKEKDEGEDKKLKNGTYDITAKAMNADSDEPSGAAGFISEDAQIIIKDGNVKLKIGVPENDMATIEGIQVESKKGKTQTKDNVKYYTFNLNELKEELSAQVQYAVPQFNIDHDVPFRFILEGLDEIPEFNDETEGKSTYETPKEEEDSKKEKSQDDSKVKPKEDPKTTKITPDKEYYINYTIKHEDGIQDSVANDFFTNKGILLEKDNKTYVQMTITEGDMVSDLKNKYGEALLVNEKKDGSIVVQLRVNNDLANMPLNMHIIVPEGAIPGFPGYDENHKALLVFDKDSIEEKEVENFILGTGSKLISDLGDDNDEEKDNGKKTKLGTNDNTDNIVAGLKDKDNDLDKPDFGSTGDNADSKKDKSENPQTGDLTNIWLYAFLLAGSLLVLGFKFRRRTI